NAYVLDPAHIAPSRSDANSNGHFPQSNAQGATGTPRGFNLQNFGMNGMMASMPGFPMPPGTFPPFFVPGHAMQPGGWSAPPDDRGGHGPIRRGGMQGGRNYRTGPYDRRPNGRPDGGRHRGSGGGRWGDGAAGGAAVGPRE